MAAADTRTVPAAAGLSGDLGGPQGRRIPVGLPLMAVFLAYPLWWALGLAGLIWIAAAVALGLALLLGGRVTAPKSFALWIGFVAWGMVTALRLDTGGRAVGFAYREMIYIAAGVIFLYVFNASREAFPARTVLAMLACLWLVVVAGGYLGLLFPEVGFRSPATSLIPEALLRNEFVYEMMHPAFAQDHAILGYRTPRPSAPFVYTNDWGGAVAVLVPLMLAAWSSGIGRRLKVVLAVSMAAVVVPVALSLNRGLWIALGVGLLYAAIRLALRGRERPLIAIIVVCGLIAGAVLLSPLQGVIGDRLATPHSNDRRLSLTEEALDGVRESPLLGYGAPRPSRWNPNAPSVGTQGVLWLVLFSHGIPGTLLFVGWFAAAFWALRRARDPVGFWVHVMLLMFMLQWAVYDLPPATLAVVMIAIALAARDSSWGGRALRSSGAG